MIEIRSLLVIFFVAIGITFSFAQEDAPQEIIIDFFPGGECEDFIIIDQDTPVVLTLGSGCDGFTEGVFVSNTETFEAEILFEPNSTETSIPYVFTKPGIYDFECTEFLEPPNNSMPSTNKLASICIVVTSPIVPTLGEWGMVILGLGICIFGIVGIYNHNLVIDYHK